MERGFKVQNYHSCGKTRGITAFGESQSFFLDCNEIFDPRKIVVTLDKKRVCLRFSFVRQTFRKFFQKPLSLRNGGGMVATTHCIRRLGLSERNFVLCQGVLLN